MKVSNLNLKAIKFENGDIMLAYYAGVHLIKKSDGRICEYSETEMTMIYGADFKHNMFDSKLSLKDISNELTLSND